MAVLKEASNGAVTLCTSVKCFASPLNFLVLILLLVIAHLFLHQYDSSFTVRQYGCLMEVFKGSEKPLASRKTSFVVWFCWSGFVLSHEFMLDILEFMSSKISFNFSVHFTTVEERLMGCCGNSGLNLSSFTHNTHNFLNVCILYPLVYIFESGCWHTFHIAVNYFFDGLPHMNLT